MACSSIIQTNGSSSSSAMMTLKLKYDVFVSFRGEDMRYNFADHFFASLKRKGIFAFRDDTKLKKGESIAPELFNAIQASQVFIVIFSKNYASSTWCLRELEYILHCSRQVSGRRVLPIFCDVDPSEVRKQSGNYQKAFVKHEETFKHDPDMVVKRWREALTQVGNISGWDLCHKPQYAEIENIVEEIINILGHKFACIPKELVGINSPIEELGNILLLDSIDDVRVVGICGMVGIGKTTLATALYGRISHQFDACCFIDDLSKLYRHDGPIGVQKQILHQTLGQEHFQACNLYDMDKLIQSRLHSLRALIILDNVDQIKQLDDLALSRQWVGVGSRIIIVSRDEHILKEYGVDVIYKVPLLNRTDSLQLFSRKAFKLDHIMTSYEKLAYDILNYANGLPLAIKVLGSFLFGQDIPEWRSALARLRESPNKDVMDVLRLSFEGLEEMEKEIFLDIACFFNNFPKEFVKNVLNCCGFHPDVGLRVLIDKSLISISYESLSAEGCIKMHGLLQDLGRKIAQDNSTKVPRKWSRLWLDKNLYDVMSENMEKNVEAVVFYSPKEMLMTETLSKMSHLRLLILKKVEHSGTLDCLSNELKYFEWDGYPFMYLPSSFQPNHHLVELILRHSCIKQLWKGKKHLPNLRTLDLRQSKKLIKIPDFGQFPNLERLNLKGCIKLVMIDPSIGILTKLVVLNLKDCKELRSIPNIVFGLSSLKDLTLSGCFKVLKNQRTDTSENAAQSQSTPSIFTWIRSSYPSSHKDLAAYFMSSLCSLYCLREVDISFCSLSQLPDAIGCLHWLERLNLGGNNFVTLPSFKELSKLVYLNLEHCKLLESLPKLSSPASVKHDYHMLSNIKYWITGLYIFNCPKLGKRECCSNTVFSWMIQFIQSNQGSSAFFRWIDIGIVIPGNEIPSWFNNRSKGSSISMDPSPIMHDNGSNFIGVACCAVFSVVLYVPATVTCAWKCKIGLGFSNNDDGRYVYIPVNIDKGLIDVKSNHLWLIYFTRDSFFSVLSLTDKTSCNIKMETRTVDGHGLDLLVRKCGYRWIYKEDLHQMHRFRNPFAKKAKFLAIENEAEPQSFISSSFSLFDE